MSDKLNKITTIISFALFAISIIAGVWFYYAVIAMEPIPESMVVPADKVAWSMERLGAALEGFSYIVYLLVFLAVVSTVVFSAMNMFKDAKTAKNSLMSIGALFAVFILAYILASPEIPVFFGYEKFNITTGMAKAVDTGLISMYLLFVIAVGGMVYTGVRGLLR